MFGHRSVVAVLCLLFPQIKIENCIIFSDTTCTVYKLFVSTFYPRVNDQDSS